MTIMRPDVIDFDEIQSNPAEFDALLLPAFETFEVFEKFEKFGIFETFETFEKSLFADPGTLIQ